MDKKILVLQFRTGKSLIHERQCIIKSGNRKPSDFQFISILKPKIILPNDLANYSGIILGGSGQVDISCWSKENQKKIVIIKPLLEKAISMDMPMLNICFGHQLIAYILGEKVKADEKQAETGTFKIYLNKDGEKSPIFKGIPESFYAVLGHKDSVVKLPKNTKLLAYSDKCSIQAYQLKNNIYCVQFHPELNKIDLKYRLNLFPRYRKEESTKEIMNKYNETPYSTKVVNNFINLCKSIN